MSTPDSKPTATGIAGVRIVPLARFVDARGAVLRMRRADDPDFVSFGEVYFSLVHAGIVKAWRRHTRTTANMAVPVGTVRLVLIDGRADSPTTGHVIERLIGEPDYCLVTIPPGVWSGFRAEGGGSALVANCLSEVHDPGEVESCDAASTDMPYLWTA